MNQCVLHTMCCIKNVWCINNPYTLLVALFYSGMLSVEAACTSQQLFQCTSRLVYSTHTCVVLIICENCVERCVEGDDFILWAHVNDYAGGRIYVWWSAFGPSTVGEGGENWVTEKKICCICCSAVRSRALVQSAIRRYSGESAHCK